MKDKQVLTYKNIKEITCNSESTGRIILKLNKSKLEIIRNTEKVEIEIDGGGFKIEELREYPLEIRLSGILESIIIPLTFWEKIWFYISLPFKKLKQLFKRKETK